MDPALASLVAPALNALFGIASLAIVALGLAVVLGLLGVLNLAHGELVMVGAYCAYVVQANGLPYVAAVPFAIALCAIVVFAILGGVLASAIFGTSMMGMGRLWV